MFDALLRKIDDKREALVGLTRDLVRIPTVNPPGEAYAPCAQLVGERLRRRGFDVQYVRGEGAPGDSERYPRLNVVARREGARPGPCVHFNSHIDVVETGHGWTVDPWAGEVRDGRIYGRGTCDMKGGLAASIVAVETLLESGVELPGALEISGTVDEEFGRLRRRRASGAPGLLLAAAGGPRDHPGAAQRRSGVHRPSRGVVGRGRDERTDRARLDAVSRRLRDPPHGGLSRPGGARAPAQSRRPRDGHARGARRSARLDAQPQQHPRRAGGRVHRPAEPLRAGQLPPRPRPPLSHRGGSRGGEAGGGGHPGEARCGSGRAFATRCAS